MSFNLFNKVTTVLNGKDEEAHMPPVPEEVTNFLGKLSLLEGVPLHNLITDERYLPVKKAATPDAIEKGSLKLFWIDPEWIESLLNGALSIADDADNLMLKKAMEGKYTAEFFYNEAKEKIKKQISGQYSPTEFKQQLVERLKEKRIEYGNPVPTTAQTNWRYTGFFIRSSIISLWAGVEIIAYGEPDKEGAPRRLQVIKLERVATDTIFCICEGIITMVEIIPPAETLHFDLNDLNPIPMRQTQGVLDIKKIVNKPTANYKAGNEQAANSASFASNILSTPIKTRLTITRK